MKDAEKIELVAELHRRQGEMYAGGSIVAVEELLARDIVWHVPGTSPLAGEHRGIAEVTAYFERRRLLARATMQMRPGSKAVCSGDAVAQFVEGAVILDGEQVTWQTVGVYRFDPERPLLREVWLIPLDLALFERIWTRLG